jgi:hypothetical protein
MVVAEGWTPLYAKWVQTFHDPEAIRWWIEA